MPVPQSNVIPGSLILVVHGAEIFDSGEAAWLIAMLKPSRTIVAGVMARTAAEESGLPVIFDGAPPSRILHSLGGPMVLANHAKTPESGRIFGSIVAFRLEHRGLIQVECSDKTVILWGDGDHDLAAGIAALTGYQLRCGTVPSERAGPERRIRGCLPGESVYVNGIIIGQATGDTVVIKRSGTTIDVVSGLTPKEHGLEKLRNTPPDLVTAWCKSGPIRHAPAAAATRTAPPSGRIAVIDHCGHELYTAITPDCCGVLAIGDDTTAVCGHICAHRGIPVLGIVDGDQDTSLPAAFAPGSVVLECITVRDDDLGKDAARMIGGEPAVWQDYVAQVLARFSDRTRIVSDTRERP